MSNIPRDIPKTVAAFGEKQFNETGAQVVEVLRVKAAVMRKHFRQLKGILFLVAVVSLDRIRVYFFNASGVLVIGENLEQSMYDKIRKSSKIVAKFEKPKQLTPEELRIEATQELRDSLGKAIRKVSRFLALKEPTFPDIFVTKTESSKSSQNFGLQITEDGEFLFEERILSQTWLEGLLLRTAYLIHLQESSRYTLAASSIGNAIGLALLKGQIMESWLKEWRKNSKDTEWLPILNHFVRHHESYTPESYNWLVSIIDGASRDLGTEGLRDILSVVHDSLVLPITTEEYHIIDGFNRTLQNPRQLEKRRYKLSAVHLAPRTICDPSSLDISLSLSVVEKPTSQNWAQIHYLDGKNQRYIEINDSFDQKITSIEYWLNFQDIYPSSGSPFSHGRDIIRRALEKIGISKPIDGSYEAHLSINDNRTIDQKEHAVLERLCLGKLEILANTLVGSPLVLNALIEKGCIILVPDFYHIGINQDFILHGTHEDVSALARMVPEATVFGIQNHQALAVISTPSSWRQPLINSAVSTDVEIYPIVSVESSRGLLRNEPLFHDIENPVQWS